MGVGGRVRHQRGVVKVWNSVFYLLSSLMGGVFDHPSPGVLACVWLEGMAGIGCVHSCNSIGSEKASMNHLLPRTPLTIYPPRSLLACVQFAPRSSWYHYTGKHAAPRGQLQAASQTVLHVATAG